MKTEIIREALEVLISATSCVDESDVDGNHVCCDSISYNPHRADCIGLKALAALDAEAKADPALILKHVLFKLLEAESPPTRYGGVLVSSDPDLYAYIDFRIGDRESGASGLCGVRGRMGWQSDPCAKPILEGNGFCAEHAFPQPRVKTPEVDPTGSERKIKHIGDEVHNASCTVVHLNEEIGNDLGLLATELWNWDKSHARPPVKVPDTKELFSGFQGCTSHDCIVTGGPSGMGTNGACQCLVNASRVNLIMLQARIKKAIWDSRNKEQS